jgi:membrane protein YdbS with pleckstrin-like domain
VAYPDRLLSPDEEIVRAFRPHWLALVWPVVWAILLVAAIVAASLFLDDPQRWIVTVGAVGIWLIASARRVMEWWTTQHVITNERVIYRAGILSRRGKEIPLEVINDVAFSQTVLERMFRSGDLLIESAGEMGQSRYSDIRDPEGLQSLIYQVRESRMMAIRGTQSRSPASDLEALANLRDRGVLSDAEFEAQKRKLLDSD